MTTAVAAPRAAPFDLLETKLAPPPLRAGTVTRCRIDGLRAERSDSLVVVTAPAGYGKTTLLASWVKQDRRPFAWLSVDERDSDPAVLLTYVAAALDGIEPIDPSVFEALGSPSGSIWTAAVPRLASAVARMSRPFVLVLDDVHLLGEPECLDALATLAAAVPEGSQMILASRAVPALPLARLRAAGELLEIKASDLRMDVEEAGSLLGAAGLELPVARIAELTEQTEGWPAGLYLAALGALSSEESLASARFDDSDAYVADYLRLEVLARLPTDEVEFLTRSAVAEPICGSLVDALLARRDSARMLESLESRNLFVIPLDRSRTWYRYHHLFRDLLRAELERREPELVPELNGRAAAWLVANGRPEAAVECARAAGDMDLAATLVGALVIPVYQSGRIATAERWLEWFERDGLLEQYPLVALLGAWQKVLTGQPEAGERWAAYAEQGRFEGALPDGTESFEVWVAVLRVITCPDGIERMRTDAELAIAHLPVLSPFAVTAFLGLGVAHLLGGDADAADAALATAMERALQNERRGSSVTLVLAERALLAWQRDDWAEAKRFTEEALVAARGIEGYMATALTLVASARVAAHEGEVERARQLAMHVQQLRPRLTHATPWLSTQVCLELARVQVALGDVDGARTVLAQGEEILRRRPDLGVLGEEVAAFRRLLTTIVNEGDGWSASLTAAELRLLPYLPTHLSFREIGERLHISRNTVKTEAISVYRKLSVSSRGEAVKRAAELGLLESTSVGS